MRPVFRIDMKLTTRGAALCVLLASMMLPVDVIAQVVAPAADSSTPSVASVPAASLDDGAANTSSVAAQTSAGSTGGADVASSNDMLLDDQMLSRQRHRGVQRLVAATPPRCAEEDRWRSRPAFGRYCPVKRICELRDP